MMTRDARTHRPAARPLPPLSAMALVLLSCSDATPDPMLDNPEHLTTVHLTPGKRIATFASIGRLSLDDVRGIALAPDGMSVYVLDTHAVHHLGLNGRPLASMGGEGRGPGELEAPTAIHAAAGGGAWVYDPASGRATRYGPDALVEAEISGIDHRDAPFVPFGDGVLVAAVRMAREAVEGPGASDDPRMAIRAEELNPNRLLSHYRGSGEELEVESPPGVPDAFARDGRRGRVIGWRMAAISATEIAVVIGGSDLGAWRLVLADGGERIDSIAELPVPADVRGMVRERAALGRGVFTMPIASARVVGGVLWVLLRSPGPEMIWDGPRAFGIPLDGSAASLRIDRGAIDVGGEIVDMIVLPDRVVVATRTAVSFLALEPA